MFKYPPNDNHRTGELLGVLGSFWSDVFTDREMIEHLMRGKGQLHSQNYQDLLELVDSASRHKVPIFHKDNWYFVELLESQVNSGDAGLRAYGDAHQYGESGQYGGDGNTPPTVVTGTTPLPPDNDTPPLPPDNDTPPLPPDNDTTVNTTNPFLLFHDLAAADSDATLTGSTFGTSGTEVVGTLDNPDGVVVPPARAEGFAGFHDGFVQQPSNVAAGTVFANPPQVGTLVGGLSSPPPNVGPPQETTTTTGPPEQTTLAGLPGRTFSWDIHEPIENVPVVMNRLSSPSRVLVDGVDYTLDSVGITFRADPFRDDLLPKREVVVDNVVVDRAVGLWLFRSDFDRETVYRQWGYVLQLQLKSSEAYRDYLNVIFDAIVGGSSTQHIRSAFSLLTGIPLVREDVETVEDIVVTARVSQVITNRHVYNFGPNARVSVVVGEVLTIGDTMTADLEFLEFHRGQVPDDATVPYLSTGPSLMSFGFSGDIVWENKEVPLVVETDQDGRTKVSWELRGWPGDAEMFFDLTHRQGLETGKTLANFLDTRTNPVGDPDASQLPKTVNPFELLAFNLFRKFTMLVRFSGNGTGCDPLGLHAGSLLQKIIPPHTAVLLQVQLDYREGPVTLATAGEPSPNYTENARTFTGNFVSGSLDSGRLTDSAKIYQIQGNCR